MAHKMSDEHNEMIVTAKDLPVITMFRKMTRDIALMWIQNNRKWDADLIEDMLGFCLQPQAQAQPQQLATGNDIMHYAHYQSSMALRKQFCASAWMLGASWNQLGSLFSITREAVQRQVDRIMPPHVRAPMRQRPPISYERLSDMYAAFLKIIEATGPTNVMALTPPELAKLITANIVDPDTLDGGIQSRISGGPNE